MSTRPVAFGSFGAPAVDEPKDEGQQPVPVLHVGEVHAELHLHLSDDTLSELGAQLAALVEQATREGFDAGMRAAFGDEPGDGQEAAR